MVQCKKCKLFLSLKGVSSNETLKCISCDSYYHKKCVRNVKTFADLGKCEDCSKSSPLHTPKLSIDPSKATTEGILTEINKKLEILYKMRKTLDDLTESVDFYAEQYLELMQYKENSEKRIKALEQKNINLEKCNLALEERVVALESRDREKNIEIVGLEKIEGENLKETVEKIAQKLNLNSNQIVEVRRVGAERPNNAEQRPRPRPVVVTLTSRAARDQWLLKRKTRLTNADIYNNQSSKPIFINEDISKRQRQLFWLTKTDLKSKYKYIWINRGCILVRKDDENRKIHTIRSEQDINRLIQSGE